jgi:hypothetical protein
MTIKAIYRDVADPNNQFSGVVVRTADGWRIQTEEHGPRNIEYYLQEKTAVGGVLEFVDYEIYSEQNLRPADIISFINSVRATLPWPVKPADPPRTEPEDTRLHIEPRQPGESSFSKLKEAGNKAAARYRANRERERQQAQQEMQPSSQQIAQVRNINNYLAAQMRPKRSTGE